MSFTDLFDSGSHVRNFTHFASLVNLAAVDGAINAEEEAVLKRVAHNLDISDADYKKAMENPNKFPVNPPNTNMERLERLYDLLRVIFADRKMTPKEFDLLKKYAIALGFSSEDSKEVLERSIRILGGDMNFEDYIYLLRKRS